MSEHKSTKNIIEALLIVSEGGLSVEDLKKAITGTDEKDIVNAINVLREEYSSSGRAFNIAEIAGRYRIVSKPEYMPWIGNLYQKEIERLTGPSLETLAIIAYKQPVTRSEVENVRGVNVGGVIKALLDKGLIRIKGRKDVIGRPLIYETTELFLEIFGLNSLEDLPALKEFSEEDLEYGKPREQVEVEDTEYFPEGTSEPGREDQSSDAGEGFPHPEGEKAFPEEKHDDPVDQDGAIDDKKPADYENTEMIEDTEPVEEEEEGQEVVTGDEKMKDQDDSMQDEYVNTGDSEKEIDHDEDK